MFRAIAQNTADVTAMCKKLTRIAAVACLASLVDSAVSGAGEPARGAEHCFTGLEIGNWRAPDANTVFIRTNFSRVYRLDLTHACGALKSRDPRLVWRIRTAGRVCSATDLDLRASDGFLDVPEPCFIKSLTELSPAEAANLPSAARP